jgi:hypothetical protein
MERYMGGEIYREKNFWGRDGENKPGGGTKNLT